MKEYNSTMKISVIKKDMRETVMQDIMEFLKKKYPTVGLVGSNTIGVAMGTYLDEGNFPSDTCCEVKISAKPFYSKDEYINEKGQKGREIKFYDLATLMENYEKGVEE